MTQQAAITAITSAISPILEADGKYLEDVTIVPIGKSSLVTVIIDSDEGLNLDHVTSLSREISEVIDLLPELGDKPFTLEVTSPGIDRPLTLPRHWRKNKNRLVKITTTDGAVHEGRISDSTESHVLINGSTVNFSEIKKALIQIEFKSTISFGDGSDE